MKIGLVRHFKVMDDSKNLWMTSSEFNNWVEYYDQCDLKAAEGVEEHDWEACYSSDQLRALKTAKQLFDGKIQITELLREIGIHAYMQKPIKLHRSMWLIFSRLGWLFNHRSQEAKRHTLLRAQRIINEIEQSQHSSILVVSHGAFMTVLRDELKRRGYKGPAFLKPVNGKVYLFESAH